jgi:hypothetical protein
VLEEYPWYFLRAITELVTENLTPPSNNAIRTITATLRDLSRHSLLRKFALSFELDLALILYLTTVALCKPQITYTYPLNLDVKSSLHSVTSVGGTTNIPEVAVSRFFSGGGFSDYVCVFEKSLKTPISYLRCCSSSDLPIRRSLSTHISIRFQKEPMTVSSIRELLQARF